MGAWGCIKLPCPGSATGVSPHSQAVLTASPFLQNCLLGCFHLLLHTDQSPVYSCLAPRSIQGESHGVNTQQRCSPSTG